MKITYINRATGNIETEHPPGEGFLRFLYDNTFGNKIILPLAKQLFLTKWYGKMMESPSSVNRIQAFVDELNIDMSESEKSIEEFKTFNDFFYRKLKAGARQIQDGLVSPGDGKLLAFEKVAEVNSFFVKGREFTLKEFLKDDALEEKYKNASMVILRLAPNDYHRYHFPFSGTPSKSIPMDGMYYTVSPIGLKSNFTEIFCENKKEFCELSTSTNGDILIIPVGATMVGSINSSYEPGTEIEKGTEMGYFAFGGSTIVLLFDSKNFKLDSDLLANTKNNKETFIKMGERIAISI